MANITEIIKIIENQATIDSINGVIVTPKIPSNLQIPNAIIPKPILDTKISKVIDIKTIKKYFKNFNTNYTTFNTFQFFKKASNELYGHHSAPAVF